MIAAKRLVAFGHEAAFRRWQANNTINRQLVPLSRTRARCSAYLMESGMRAFVVLGVSSLSLLWSIDSFAETKFPDACRVGGTEPSMSMPMDTMPMADSKAGGEYTKASMAGMMSMSRDMAAGMANMNPDVAFICGMIAHHIGAVKMSELELRYGSDPTAKALATKIIAEQNEELKAMTDWVGRNVRH